MTDDNALEMLHKLFDEAGASCMQVDNYLNVAIGDLRANFSEYKDGTLCMTLQNFVTPEQAIAVTLGSEQEAELVRAMEDVLRYSTDTVWVGEAETLVDRMVALGIYKHDVYEGVRPREVG